MLLSYYAPLPPRGTLCIDDRLSVCLSVCMSVCPVPDPKSRTEGLMKLKSGRKEGRGMSDP